MPRVKIRKMLLEIIQEIDYDIYKEYANPEAYGYDKEDIEERLDVLIDIVNRYIGK